MLKDVLRFEGQWPSWKVGSIGKKNEDSRKWQNGVNIKKHVFKIFLVSLKGNRLFKIKLERLYCGFYNVCRYKIYQNSSTKEGGKNGIELLQVPYVLGEVLTLAREKLKIHIIIIRTKRPIEAWK